MPFIRGYIIYGRGDILTHIGYIKDILATAHIEHRNFYPIDHILSAALYYITNIKISDTIKIIPPIFSLFYIISIYLLASQILKRKGEVLFILMFASILLFRNENLMFAPSVQSFFLLPFVLYIYFKRYNLKNPLKLDVLLSFMAFIIAFFHPMTMIFFLSIFFMMGLYWFIYNRGINKKRKKQNSHQKLKLETKTILIVSIYFIAFIIWCFIYPKFVSASIKVVLNWFIYKKGGSEFKAISSVISYAHPKLLDLIEVGFYRFGQIIVLGLMTFIFLIRTFSTWRKSKLEKNEIAHYIFFLIGFLIFAILSVATFFNYFIIGFGRVSRYVIFFSSIAIGLGFYLLFMRLKISKSISFMKKRVIAITLLCIVLFLLLFFSIFNLYFSPIIKMENQQVAKGELKGMQWFFDHRNENFLIEEIEISQMRFYDALFGCKAPEKNIRYGISTLPPNHFGYNNKTFMGESYNESCYLIIPRLGRIFYPEMYPKYEEYWRFESNDFNKLEKDQTVEKIYSCGDLDIYLIR